MERFIGIILTMEKVKGGNHIRYSSSELLNFNISEHTRFITQKLFVGKYC